STYWKLSENGIKAKGLRHKMPQKFGPLSWELKVRRRGTGLPSGADFSTAGKWKTVHACATRHVPMRMPHSTVGRPERTITSGIFIPWARVYNGVLQANDCP